MAEALIISNTTPLINFAEIGRMDILSELFGRLVIPSAVVEELKAKPLLFPQAAKVASHPALRVENPSDDLLVKGLLTHLHRGEAECLALAFEHPGSLLLLDDLAAREMAGANGILFTGTLGCLIRAKQSGLLPSIEPVLEELRQKARFWISPPLVDRILRSAGER